MTISFWNARKMPLLESVLGKTHHEGRRTEEPEALLRGVRPSWLHLHLGSHGSHETLAAGIHLACDAGRTPCGNELTLDAETADHLGACHEQSLYTRAMW